MINFKKEIAKIISNIINIDITELIMKAKDLYNGGNN